ncbi:MAG: MarR family winged helix-turn-helix transcriptional regulator [Canibacter sp.]
MHAQRTLMHDFSRSDVWQGIPVRDYDVLLNLSRNGGKELRQSDLLSQWMIPQPSMSRMIDRLVQKGYVSRRKDPRDGRSTLLKLTDEGKAIQRKIANGHVQDVSERLLNALTLDEIQQLEALTTKLVTPVEGGSV